MQRLVLAKWVLLAVSLTAWATSALPQPNAPSQKVAELIAWYDALGFPDTTGRPYVRVATGMWRQIDNGPRENQFLEGFLLEEDAASFTVFVSGVQSLEPRRGGTYDPDLPESQITVARLRTVRFVRKDEGPDFERVSYEPRELRLVAAGVLESVRKATPDNEDAYDELLLPLGYPPPSAQVVGFARELLRNGVADVGNELLETIVQLEDEEYWGHTLLDALQQGIGRTVVEQVEHDMAFMAVSRAELAQVYSAFAGRFPASNELSYAQRSAEVLTRMLAEETAHVARPLAALSAEEQAEQLVYELRDLRLSLPYQIAGRRYPFEPGDPAGDDGKTAAHRLIDLGHAAVPALIAALEDDSYTRTAILGIRLHPVRAQRVSGIALVILEHMSGRNLRSNPGGPALSAAAARPRAEAWWNEVRSGGTLAQLTRDTAAGGAAGAQAARRLVELDPQAALVAIEIGAAATLATVDRAARVSYIESAAKIPGDAPNAFLRTQLNPQAGIVAQAAAGQALIERGQRDAVPALVAAWRDAQPRLWEPRPPMRPGQPPDPFFEIGPLISVLATSNYPEAIDGLAQHGRNAPVEVRLAVLRAFEPSDQPADRRIDVSPATRPMPVLYRAPDLSAGETSTAIERLLRAALSDREPLGEATLTIGTNVVVAARVCDLAASILTARWPERFSFDASQPVARRDAAIAELR